MDVPCDTLLLIRDLLRGPVVQLGEVEEEAVQLAHAHELGLQAVLVRVPGKMVY